MQTLTQNYFASLNAINVSEHIEKKGPFSYLSWPFAVAQLRLIDPSATWEVKRFDGLPFLKSDADCFVEVAVTVQGNTLSQLHPVAGQQKQTDCVTDRFRYQYQYPALFGQGHRFARSGSLYLCREDLPDSAKTETLSVSQQETIKTMIEEVDGNLDRLLAYFKVKGLGGNPGG